MKRLFWKLYYLIHPLRYPCSMSFKMKKVARCVGLPYKDLLIHAMDVEDYIGIPKKGEII